MRLLWLVVLAFSSVFAVLDLVYFCQTSAFTGRAVASLEEADGHQHLAGGTGVGSNKCLPFRRGGPGVATPGIFLVYFL